MAQLVAEEMNGWLNGHSYKGSQSLKLDWDGIHHPTQSGLTLAVNHRRAPCAQ